MPFEMDRSRTVARGDAAAPVTGRRFEMNIGHACDQHCVFCMQAGSGVEHRRFVPLAHFITELQHYRSRGVVELGVLGGEPTLYPWLFEALAEARDLGYTRITLNSNGSRLADRAFTVALAEAGVTRFALSVHSHRPEVEERLDGRPGALADKLAGIGHLRELQERGRAVSISLNPVLNRLNMDDIPGFVTYYHGLGVTDIRFNAIRPEGGARNNRDLVPRYREVMPRVLDAVLRNERRWRISLSFGELPLCQWPRTLLGSPDLCRRYIGELRDLPTNVTEFLGKDAEGRRRFLWQDLRREVLKQAPAPCRTCAVLGRCGGLWTNYAEMYGVDEVRPFQAGETLAGVQTTAPPESEAD